jgi:phospholipase/lecithinase/hemolysin
MKQFKHIQRAAILASTLGLLLACGSSGSPTTTVIAFGDSLTDGGTYKNGYASATATITSLGGGRFTTNGPNAKTWAEVVATGIGTSSSFMPAAFEGFSIGYNPVLACTTMRKAVQKLRSPMRMLPLARLKLVLQHKLIAT